jgi:hypothetical protein
MSNETTTQTESNAMNTNKSKKNDPLAEMRAELARIKAENEALKAKAAQRANTPITLKVSEKGAVSAYGLGRFPVTLYAEQWTKLLSDQMVTNIRDFIRDHKDELSSKADKLAAAAAQG